ncbi:hypothetical protein O9K51_06370 [Purpureocillium lavendulum]|uniref:F-box domain-containing protein n=1 Tax=Purpureocillium lavendulum TaxID=1247861 RepID=A0AB34FQZ2_9HYPO|nr:hypothetical protein O9K51_06370 [Purpureocillium lavendulum]
MAVSSASSPALTGLPVEVLRMICVQFSWYHGDRKTFADRADIDALLALSLTSRALSSVAQPFLYYDPVPATRFHVDPEAAPFPLLRTLVERPDLAACVRRLGAVPDEREGLDNLYFQLLLAISPNIDTAVVEVEAADDDFETGLWALVTHLRFHDAVGNARDFPESDGEFEFQMPWLWGLRVLEFVNCAFEARTELPYLLEMLRHTLTLKWFRFSAKGIWPDDEIGSRRSAHLPSRYFLDALEPVRDRLRHLHLDFGYNLSVELQRMICAQLCWHCCDIMHEVTEYLVECRDALMALSVTSRQMRAIAQPFIYHYVPGSYQPGRPRLWPFIRTLNSRPDLAASVKWLGSLIHIPPFNEAAAIKQCKDIGRSRQLFLDGDPDFNVFTGPVNAISERENCDALLLNKYLAELVVTLTTGIEMLDFGIEMDDLIMDTVETTCPFLASRFKRLQETPGLSSLRALKLSPVSTAGFRAAASGISVLLRAAPNLEQLRFDGCAGPWRGDRLEADDDFYVPYEPLDMRVHVPVMENLRSLSFVERQCPRLEHFQYRSQRPSPEYVEFDLGDIKHHRLISALQPAQETLRVLDLYIRGISEAADVPKIGPLLAKFKRLEVLKLDELAFCQHLNHDPARAYPSDRNTCIIEMLPPTRMYTRKTEERIMTPDRYFRDAQEQIGDLAESGVDVSIATCDYVGNDPIYCDNEPETRVLAELR